MLCIYGTVNNNSHSGRHLWTVLDSKSPAGQTLTGDEMSAASYQLPKEGTRTTTSNAEAPGKLCGVQEAASGHRAGRLEVSQVCFFHNFF